MPAENGVEKKISFPEELIRAYRERKRKRQRRWFLFYIFSAIFLLAILSFGGFSIYQKLSVPKEKIATPIMIKRTQIVVGQPTKWVALVPKSQIENGKYLAKLPKGASDIKVATIAAKQAEKIALSKPKQQLSLKQRQQVAITPTKSQRGVSVLTAGITSAIQLSFDKLSDVLSSVKEIIIGSTYIDLTSYASQKPEYVAIEYTTPAPKIASKLTDTGLKVKVSSVREDKNAPLTNVIVSTKIPEILKVGQQSKIKIKWINNSNKKISLRAYDTDKNGYLDYAEWTVPHLSEQTFELIFVSKAFQLDQNKNILVDIYEQVRTKDNIWAQLTNGQYMRVTFEKTLNNKKDITVYAKPTNSNQPATIRVYPIYKDKDGNTTQGPLVTTFPKISQENIYKVFLNRLKTPTDTFDLKIVGNIDVDYIVDPPDTTPPSIEFTTPPTPADQATIYVDNFEVAMATSDTESGHYSFVNFDDSLVGWWRGEDNANDESGNGNNGTLHGDATYTSGQFGQAFTFDGSNDYFEVSSPASLSDLTTQPYTISFWLNPNNWNNSLSDLVSWMCDSPNFPGFGIEWNEDPHWGPNGLYFWHGGWTYAGPEENQPPLQTWTHYVALFDGSYLKIYINGVQSGDSVPASPTESCTDAKLVFGVHSIHSEPQRYYNGAIDDVLIFKRALSADEISSLYDAQANQYNHSFTSLANGNHTIKGYAVDAAGNKSETEKRTITIAIYDCSSLNNCSGHGTCIADNTCSCDEGFTGDSCDSCDTNYYSYPTCVYCLDSETCSGHGTCASDGSCVCDAGYAGINCLYPISGKNGKDVELGESKGQTKQIEEKKEKTTNQPIQLLLQKTLNSASQIVGSMKNFFARLVADQPVQSQPTQPQTTVNISNQSKIIQAYQELLKLLNEIIKILSNR